MTIYVLHYDSSTMRTYAASVSDGDIAANGVQSGAIAQSGFIVSGHLGANVIGGIHIFNQSLVSANYASGSIGGTHVASGAIAGANIAATAVASANIAVGAVGGTLVQNYGIISGKMASGSVNSTDLASGISISIAQIVQETTFKASQPVSAFMCVQFTTSGYFAQDNAMNYSSMPTIGIATANIASGAVGTFQYRGRLTATSGVWNFSGYNGLRVFTGVSSEVTVSGPSVSGSCVQAIGKTISLDTIMVTPDLLFIQIAQ